MGIGLPFTIRFASSGTNEVFPIEFTLIQIVLTGGLLTSLTATLIMVPLQQFRIGRVYGTVLILIYLAFLTIAILVETGNITGHVGGNKCTK